jgi:hypothetical protein
LPSVTPTYYVLFTFCTLVTSTILYQGFKASAAQIITIVFGFLVICTGIFILQMSRIDPRKLKNVDRRTTILLQAAREEIKPTNGSLGACGSTDTDGEGEVTDIEKKIEMTEDPGMDAVAGRFGGVGGTVVRARRRATIAGTRRRGTRKRSGTATSGMSTMTTRSEGMDSVRARQLQREWLDEKNTRKANGVEVGENEVEGTSSSEMTHVAGMPVTSGLAKGNGHPHVGGFPVSSEQTAQFMSSEQLTISPTASPQLRAGTSSDADLRRTPSVRFQDQQPQTQARPMSSSSSASNAHGTPSILVPSRPSTAVTHNRSHSNTSSMSIPDISHHLRSHPSPPVPPIPSAFLAAASRSSIDQILSPGDVSGHGGNGSNGDPTRPSVSQENTTNTGVGS